MNLSIKTPVALAVLWSLVACGGGSDPSAPVNEPTAPSPAPPPPGGAPAPGPAPAPGAPSPAPAPPPSSSPAPSPPASAPAPSPNARVFHVRTDGGSAQQCNGRSDAAYPGAGTGQDCAWASPMIALPPTGGARIKGGDTLLIHAGAYAMGLGAPGAESCSRSAPWDCAMQAVPSGPDATTPTRIIGGTLDGACAVKPQLWGNQHSAQVLDLRGTQHAEVSCLDITDRSACVEHHANAAMACNRDNYPYGAWASHGIVASDSRNVKLQDLDIHGMANRGVLAGRLTDWTVERVRIAASGWANWDGDIDEDGTGKGSSNSGTLRFTRWLVEYAGCGETYPELKPVNCSSRYGDGVGTGKTDGNWIIEDSTFRNNSSDGLDLLYHRKGSVTLNRVQASGNAGNQIKIAGRSSITNSVVLGNCGNFSGKSYTYKVDNCRAVGDAVVVVANAASDVLKLTNNTIVSAGNVAVMTRGPTGSVLKMRNNILVGLPMFVSPGQQSADTYTDNWVKPGLKIDEAYSIKQDLRNAVCSRSHTICGNAGLVSVTDIAVNPRLQSTSPARDSGTNVDDVAPSGDLYRAHRPAGRGYDRGAVEAQ